MIVYDPKFYALLDKVKKEYKKATGKKMMPIDDWSDATLLKFAECVFTDDCDGFLEYYKNDIHG